MLHGKMFAAKDGLVLLGPFNPPERTLSRVQETRFHLAATTRASHLGVRDLSHPRSVPASSYSRHDLSVRECAPDRQWQEPGNDWRVRRGYRPG
jgi:hypothetical protein